MKIYRQGDVLIKEISALPQGIKKTDSVTLAEGEVTGHSHRFINQQSVQLFEPQIKHGSQDLFLEVKEDAELIHEEHNQITITKGYYVIMKERELSMDAVQRQVLD